MEILILILTSLSLFAFGTLVKFKGQTIFVAINTGTVASPTWTPIGGQKEATLDRGKGTIDTTDKDSGGNVESLSIVGAKGDAAVASFTLKGSGPLVKETI